MNWSGGSWCYGRCYHAMKTCWVVEAYSLHSWLQHWVNVSGAPHATEPVWTPTGHFLGWPALRFFWIVRTGLSVAQVLTQQIPVYTWCTRRILAYFGSPFRRLIHSDTNKRTHIRIWTVTTILAGENVVFLRFHVLCMFNECYVHCAGPSLNR